MGGCENGGWEVGISGVLCPQDLQNALGFFSNSCYHEVLAAAMMPPDRSHRFSSRVEILSSMIFSSIITFGSVTFS